MKLTIDSSNYVKRVFPMQGDNYATCLHGERRTYR